MSIKILTLKEAAKTQAVAKQYGECFEQVIGTAVADYICDNSNDQIPKGTQCAAVMILPFRNHPNYEHQKAMLHEYVDPK